MTGYRTQLTGYFGYEAQQHRQLVPVSEVTIPRLAIFDATRVGFAHDLVETDAVVFPSQTQASSDIFEAVFPANDLLAGSRRFEEPFGTITDC